MSSILFLLPISYTVFKHRLLDIRLIILRTVTYSLIVLLISVAFIVIASLSLQFTRKPLSAESIFLAIALAVLVTLTLDPLKRAIGRLTDRLFFKGRIDYATLLQNLSEIINREIDLERLLTNVPREVAAGLKIQSATIFLAASGAGPFFERPILKKRDPDHLGRLERAGPLIRYLITEGRIVVLEALERKIEDTSDLTVRADLEASKAKLDQLNAAVVAPVTVENRLTAILALGPKLSGDPFSDDDLNLLQLLGPQLASALEKARLYDEVKQFSEKLKKEVAIATEDLRSTNAQLGERNRFLSALQKATSLITRSLNFKKVTQDIVDSIHRELGFVGGLLLFLGDSRRKIFPEAMTQSKLTGKIIKMLPKPLMEYYGDYQRSTTKSSAAIRTGETQTGDRLSDFISPPVPKAVCDAIQHIAKMKAIVAVPVPSEDEVVGCIDFFLDRDPKTLTKTDFEMMRSLANETGIVYRNITLVQKLEATNRDLAVANEHLKQLDQAKSEFVSIASHQLRTPMTGIMGYLSMLVDGDYGKFTSKQRVIIETLLDESERMIRLINLFLNVSKIESGKLQLTFQPVQVEAVIEKQVNVLAKVAEDKGLALTFLQPKKSLPKITADADKVGDVILNLTDNAIKYTEQGSVEIRCAAEAGGVHVTVSDTGRGVDPKEAKELFAKFVRGFGIAQINPDGSGLGLYVARRVVEAHGGKIWVESPGVGKGSTFHFTLPIKAKKA